MSNTRDQVWLVELCTDAKATKQRARRHGGRVASRNLTHWAAPTSFVFSFVLVLCTITQPQARNVIQTPRFDPRRRQRRASGALGPHRRRRLVCLGLGPCTFAWPAHLVHVSHVLDPQPRLQRPSVQLRPRYDGCPARCRQSQLE